MPTVPLVAPPVTPSAGTSNVRVSPNLYAPLARADQSIAQGIDDASNFAARVKHASDTSYLIGAQAKMEATQQGFHTWTMDHPDTDGWQEEWQARQQNVLDDVQKGGQTLTPMAKLHLKTETTSWQTRSAAGFGQLKQQQTIKNSIGVAQIALTGAINQNDAAGATSIIETGTKAGLWNTSHAAALTKSVRVGIATNQVNADLMADPFTAVDKIEAKDDAGNYSNYVGLPQSSRTTMVFRANKMATETRTQTMRDWQQAVADARQKGAPLPDRDGLDQEAARQGISPKWVDKLYKPVAAFDPEQYATLRGDIMQYDPAKDTDNHGSAKLIESVYAGHFPAQTQSDLLSDIEKKSDPNHVFNSPMYKDGVELNNFNFTHNVYGKYETRVRDNKTGEFHTVINQQALRQAQATKARVIDAMAHFVQQNPKASAEDLNSFIVQQYRGQAAKTGATLFKFNP